MQCIGAEIDVAVVRPGYVPGGVGILELKLRPSRRLAAVTLPEPGRGKMCEASRLPAGSPNAV
jgi:RNA 3'-terminal phosphate cyclase